MSRRGRAGGGRGSGSEKAGRSVWCIIQGCLEIRFVTFLANVKIATEADHLTACWRAGLSCCGLCPKHLCPVLPALALHDVLDALKAGTALPRRPLPSAPASPASRIPSQELAGWRLSAALVSPQYSSAPSCMFLLHCVGIGICCVVLNYRKLTVATLDIIVTVLL